MLRSCVWLTAVVLVALLIIGATIAFTRGREALVAASVAAAVCWLGGTTALLIAGGLARSGKAVHGHLIGMFFRLGLPLVVGVVLQGQQGALAQAGVFGFIVVFYLITLVGETFLSLRLIKRPDKSRG